MDNVHIMKTAVIRGIVVIALVAGGCRPQEAPVSTTTSQPAAPAASSELERMAARFAPTDITADLSRLSADERTILAKLVEASKIYDALFLRQVWAGNETMLLDLIKDQTPEGRARLHYFLINKGPWSRLDHNQPFVAGAPPKPEGGSFYPADASKADIERWMRTLSEADRTRATGFFTTIRRGAGGGFHAGAVQRGVSERARAAPRRCCERRPPWRPSRRSRPS